jgi:4-alpha-glucanotransferase
MNESGVLLHISSLPNKYGIGSIGKEAYKFVDWLSECGFSRWEILPLNPAGPANSPYQTNSAFAFNMAFIDLDLLIDDGLLKKIDLRGIDFGRDPELVDFKAVWDTRKDILTKAYKRFDKTNFEFSKFKDIDIYKEYALYMTIKSHNGNKAWFDWSLEYRVFTPLVKDYVLKNYYKEYEFYLFTQFIFLKQWRILKKYANNKGIKIVGDIPYYLSLDSVEFYFHPELFLVGKNNQIDYISGYPSDAFNKHGQRWGNPLYDWAYMKVNNYKWWNERISRALELYDYVLMNHFRGFYQFYSMPYSFMDNHKGFFMEGPRLDFFKDKRNLPLIAAGVGLKDDHVNKFIKDCGYPDIRILIFGLDGDILKNNHSPYYYNQSCIVYSTNHDSLPLKAFLKEEKTDEFYSNLKKVCDELAISYNSENKTIKYLFGILLSILYKSNARCIVLSMQDILMQDRGSRMNTPGTIKETNWCYRILSRDLEDKFIINKFKKLNKQYYHSTSQGKVAD